MRKADVRPDSGATECYWCASPFVSTGLGTGYGLDDAGNRSCYPCCGVQDAMRMERGERIALYLTRSDDAWSVLNWPGSLRFTPTTVRKSRHNIARTRYDAWFWFRGVLWHGVNYGEHSEILHCRPTKTRH